MASTDPRRMTKRSRGGSPASRQFHAVPGGASPYRPALCGAKSVGYPRHDGRPGHGAGWSQVVGSKVTCRRCLGKEAGR